MVLAGVVVGGGVVVDDKEEEKDMTSFRYTPTTTNKQTDKQETVPKTSGEK